MKRAFHHTVLEPKLLELFDSATDTLYFQRLSDNAFEPHRATPDAAGFELRSAYDYVISPRDRQYVETDLRVGIPKGAYGRIAPLSFPVVMDLVQVGGGVVDRNYRGSIGVMLFNHGTEEYLVQRGAAVAQLIIEQTVPVQLHEATILAVSHPPMDLMDFLNV